MNHPPQRLQWSRLTDQSEPTVTKTTTTPIREEKTDSKDKTQEAVVIQSQNVGSVTSYRERTFLKDTFP